MNWRHRQRPDLIAIHAPAAQSHGVWPPGADAAAREISPGLTPRRYDCPLPCPSAQVPRSARMRILAELGHGGMGVVYTARDPRLKRQVAIKLLTADLTRDETAKQRFLQEAQAASALDHPNICTIYEINETDDGQLYLVMAYYEGETLKERIERGPLAVDDAVDIATQVGKGLAEAHGRWIVHRDIKPANLLIAKGGVVKNPRLRPGQAGGDRGRHADRHHGRHGGVHVTGAGAG